MNRELPEIEYSPASQLLKPGQFLRGMFTDLQTGRFLAWRLFVRNMAAQHRQSVLGYAWLLLGPIASTLVWVYLNSQKIISVAPTEIPYPAFVLAGTLLWSGFVEALQSPMQQIAASKQMLTKIHFPHEAILLAAMGQVLVNFCIRLVLLFVVFIWFDLPLTTSLLLAPLGIMALLGFGMTLGLLLTPLSMLYNDVQGVLGMALSLGFFVTPVIYPPPTEGWGAMLTNLNPITPLLVTTRQLLTGSELTHLSPFVLVSLAILVLFLFAWVAYRLAVPHIIERIGS